jgi:negative regulator of sigma-B (phosphoserine phosphatase)
MAAQDAESPLLDWGVAQQAMPGESVSGDMHLVQPFPRGVLVAVADGLGHGEEAHVAAHVAVAALRARASHSALMLVKLCHEALHGTRGAALTVASFNAVDGTMTWLGVGNVDAVLLRGDPRAAPVRDYVLLHGGVVGLQMPPLRAFVLPVTPGDTLVVATDGVRPGFAEGLPLKEPPQQLADRILARDGKGTDDALVLVARILGASA